MLSRTALAALALATAANAKAEILTCSSQVGLNRVYQATVNTDTGAMTVTNDAGTSYEGIATRIVSGRYGDRLFFLPVTHQQGVELQVENGPPGRMLMCLAANQCYFCNP